MLREKFLESARGKIYYRINFNASKRDVCLVFCHGLTADNTLFDKQTDAFDDAYGVITWDMPLHGKSVDYKGFSFKNAVADLNKILETEKISKVVLIGQSAGGYIAQTYIGEFPEKAVGFVGIGTTPLGLRYYSKSELFWIRHFTAIARLYPYGYYCKASAKSVALTAEARKNMYDTLRRLGRKGMLNAADAYYNEFLKVRDEVWFDFPALLTYGEFDNVGLVKKYNRQWAEASGLEIRVITAASHNANFDNPALFNELLREYLDKLPLQNKG